MSKKCYDGKSKGGTESYEKEKTTEEKEEEELDGEQLSLFDFGYDFGGIA